MCSPFCLKGGGKCLLIDKELIAKAKDKLGEKAAILIAKDLEIKNWNPDKLKGSCPFHDGDENPSFIWNNKSNSFYCFGCGANYDILNHYMKFYNLTYIDACERLFKETNTKCTLSEKNVHTQSRDYRYPHEEKSDRTKVEEYLALRKISKETIDYANIGADKNGNIVFHYFDTNDVLVTVKYRPSHKITSKKENKEWCQTNADTTPALFNMNKIDITQPLLITEGEIDTLSAIESGFTNAVSVPFGANNFSWIEQNFDWLEQFDKIIIWSDNDNPGVAMRKEIISRLGDWRCYYIDLPKEIEGNEVKDANEVLYYFGKEKIIDIINNAQEVPIKGVVDAYDVENYDLENSEGIYTGIKELDKKVYKIVAGTVNIITGSTGAGKSVLVNQCFIAEPLNQGYDTYVFSGELPNSQEVSWIHLVLSGREHITMASEKVHKIDKDTRQQVREWCKGRLFLHKDTNLDNRDSTILDEMEMMCRRRGVKNFVIDNMMMIDFDCDEKEVLRKQKEFMLKLLSFAKRHNAFVTLVIHPHKLDFPRRLTVGDISGSGNVTNLAHYVFSLYKYTESDKEGSKNKRGEYYKGKEPKNHDVVLDVLKNRITGFTGTGCELNFDYQSYRFYNTTDELWKRYGWNKDNTPLPTNDPKDFFSQGSK